MGAAPGALLGAARALAVEAAAWPDVVLPLACAAKPARLGDPARDWEDVRPLGSGTYGEVRLRVRPRTRDMVAVKVCKIVKIGDGPHALPREALREAAALRRLGAHANVVGVLATYVSPGDLTLVFELMECTLHDRMKNAAGPAAPDELRLVAGALCAGLAHVHACGLMHRDLKPTNVLYSERKRRVVISDFGTAIPFDPARERSRCQSDVTTLWWRAPEALMHAPYGPAVDVWAAGLIILQLADGAQNSPLRGAPKDFKTATEEQLELQQLQCIFKRLGTPDTELDFARTKAGLRRHWNAAHRHGGHAYWPRRLFFEDQDLRDLLEDMLAYDPDARVTAAVAGLHPFLKAAKGRKRARDADSI